MLILTGCHGQVYPERAFGADLVLGQNEKFRVTEFLEKRGTFRSEEEAGLMEEAFVDSLPVDKTRFFLKIQDGCDNFCSYCVVPYARGIPRSRPAGEILKIMKTLKEKGVKEVVLTGIEISAYRDPATDMNLTALLKILTKAETPSRIRMSSIDPLYIDDEFLEVMAGSEKIMKSLHIPLQSASDKVLREMGRRYTQGFMRDLIEKIRRRIPHIGIGFDVIVGFPGEDQEQFMETVRFLESIDIYYLHVFPFSSRTGTRAADMKSTSTEREKKERVRLLRELDRRQKRGLLSPLHRRRNVDYPGREGLQGKIHEGLYG